MISFLWRRFGGCRWYQRFFVEEDQDLRPILNVLVESVILSRRKVIESFFEFVQVLLPHSDKVSLHQLLQLPLQSLRLFTQFLGMLGGAALHQGCGSNDGEEQEEEEEPGLELGEGSRMTGEHFLSSSSLRASISISSCHHSHRNLLDSRHLLQRPCRKQSGGSRVSADLFTSSTLEEVS